MDAGVPPRGERTQGERGGEVLVAVPLGEDEAREDEEDVHGEVPAGERLREEPPDHEVADATTPTPQGRGGRSGGGSREGWTRPWRRHDATTLWPL